MTNVFKSKIFNTSMYLLQAIEYSFFFTLDMELICVLNILNIELIIVIKC